MDCRFSTKEHSEINLYIYLFIEITCDFYIKYCDVSSNLPSLSIDRYMTGNAPKYSHASMNRDFDHKNNKQYYCKWMTE